MKTRQRNGFTEITTLFLDRHNNYIQIYYKSISHYSDIILLTEDSHTVGNLLISGKYNINNENQGTCIVNILNRYNVFRNNDELFVYALEINFEKRKSNLIQAMILIDNLF